jgi:hypothetical protein
MPFCPVCRAEYRAETAFCPDHPDVAPPGVALVESLPPLKTYDLVEVYVCAEPVEATAIRDELLGANGIEARIHNFVSSAFPAPASQGQHRIAVPAPQAAEAIELIRSARDEGVISTAGAFLAQTA